MKIKYLFAFLSVLPMTAFASLPYRVEQIDYPTSDVPNYNRSFAEQYPFYVAGAYNFAIWDNYMDENGVFVDGKNTSGYDISVGYRVYDTFRIEAQYLYTDAAWDAFSITGNGAMVNAIFDARIDSMYRLFKSQHIIPYVGVGGGMTWVKSDDVDTKNTATPMAAALAGVSLEFGGWFAFDFGYRYFYMFSPKFDGIDGLDPTAHQFRAGARFSF